jgi:hypothetical protein
VNTVRKGRLWPILQKVQIELPFTPVRCSLNAGEFWQLLVNVRNDDSRKLF